MENGSGRRMFWIVVCLALLPRLALFAAVSHPDGFMHPPDSVGYDRLAWNLVAHGAYSLADAPPWTVDLTRTPVYPLFVACCYAMAGHQIAFAVAVQLLCSALTAAFLYSIGRRFFDATTAMTAAALLALDPLSVRYGVLLLSETVFTTLFTGLLFCTLAYLQEPRPRWLFASTLLSGLAILCRPIAILWPLALVPIFGLIARRQRSTYPLIHCALFLVGSYTFVGTWVLRNERVGGVAVLSTVQGINLYYFRAALTVADEQHIRLVEAQRILRERLEEKVKEEHLDYSQEYSLMEKWGLEISGAAPKSYVRAHLRGIAYMFLPPQRQEVFLGLDPSAVYWAESIFLGGLYVLAAAGLLTGLLGSKRLAFFLVGGVVAYFAVLSGPEAYSRFRVPVMPTVALLAGGSLAKLTRLGQEWRTHG
jgi:4-amino-4-deoxy-L-arabinose transferase-like glycosyltransferase